MNKIILKTKSIDELEKIRSEHVEKRAILEKSLEENNLLIAQIEMELIKKNTVK